MEQLVTALEALAQGSREAEAVHKQTAEKIEAALNELKADEAGKDN